MVNGQLSDSAILVLGGILALIGCGSLVLGFVAQIRKLKAEEADKIKKAVAEAEAKAVKETSSEIAFNRLTETVIQMDKNVSTQLTCMRDSFDKRQTDMGQTLVEHTEKIIKLEESAKQAHHRITEHRQVDHGFRGGNGRVENITGEAN